MDAYQDHLAQINSQREIIASEDIVNSQGQKVVQKGSRVDHEAITKIARFKLLKPLEQCIAIEDELTAQNLQQAIENFFSSEESLHLLYKKFNDPSALSQCCDYFERFSLIKQKLTVLSLQMPNVFEQSLFCAWFAIVLSKSANAETNLSALKAIFMAAICHDIGMVHISSEIVNKTSALTMDEWKAIQSHPAIGYDIVKNMKGLDPIVARAVLEHHENLDGTGYPRGCIGAMLSHEGQLINLLDSINALFVKRFKPASRSIRAVLPIIQMNQHSRFGSAAKRLIVLLRELPSAHRQEITSAQAKLLIETVRGRNQYISDCVEICGDFSNELGYLNNSPEMNALLNAIIHITMSIAQSGIINDAYMRWLEQVENENLMHAHYEVEEAFFMVQEIVYHINKFIRQLSISLEKTDQKRLSDAISTCLTKLGEQSLPALPSQLDGVWQF